MNEPTNLIEPRTKGQVIKRETILMAESQLGERVNGSRYFPTGHGNFASVKEAEVFGRANIRKTRWLVGQRVVREGEGVTYDHLSKPFQPRR